MNSDEQFCGDDVDLTLSSVVLLVLLPPSYVKTLESHRCEKV
jgi:hypothetical protein